MPARGVSAIRPGPFFFPPPLAVCYFVLFYETDHRVLGSHRPGATGPGILRERAKEHTPTKNQRYCPLRHLRVCLPPSLLQLSTLFFHPSCTPQWLMCQNRNKNFAYIIKADWKTIGRLGRCPKNEVHVGVLLSENPKKSPLHP